MRIWPALKVEVTTIACGRVRFMAFFPHKVFIIFFAFSLAITLTRAESVFEKCHAAESPGDSMSLDVWL